MTKKIAAFFNSPYLGGAERSFVHQLKLINKDRDLSIFVPYINDKKEATKDLCMLIEDQLSANIILYPYPEKLFQQSRSAKRMSLMESFIGIGQLLLTLRAHHLSRFDILWANGNKIGVVIFLWCYWKFYSGKLFWHFRDYPVQKGIFRHIWKVLKLKKSFHLQLISLSQSVSTAILETSELQARVIYNPVGESISSLESNRPLKIIGVVAMFAPWKGLHQILYWVALMQDSLRELGIERVKIYGGDLYQTRGAHQQYSRELLTMQKRFHLDLVEFCGLTEPSKIYSEIDLLIHPSISPEPFGRVLIEAFKANIPVISTCLGGAAELVVAEETGLDFFPYDYVGLFKQVERLVEDSNLRERLVEAASKHLQDIQSEIDLQLNSLIDF